MSTQDQDDHETRSIKRKVAFALVAMFLAGLASLWLGIADRMQIGDRADWNSTQANVLNVTVDEVDNSDHATYRDRDGRTRVVDSTEPQRIKVMMVEYEFETGGQRYSGSGSLGELDRAVGGSVAPQQVTVFYKRSTPSDNSMVDPDDYRSSAWVPIILGVVFLILPTATAWLWYRIEKSDWQPPQGKFEPSDSTLEIRGQDD